MGSFSPSRRSFTLGLLTTMLPASATGQAPPRRNLGIFEEIVNGSYRFVGARTVRHIFFMEWELPGQVLSTTTITRNRRSLEVTRFNADGTVEGSSENGYSRGRITDTGSHIAEQVSGDRRATYEVFRSPTGELRLKGELNGYRLDWVIERVPLDEARQIAARLYPAEYGSGEARSERPTRTSRAPSKTALVVGIGNYQNLSDLPNPVNDAQSVARKLADLGFAVQTVVNPDLQTLWDAVQHFRTSIASATAEAPALFYYGGHGIEVRGRNLLLPADTPLQAGSDLEGATVPVDTIVEQMTVGRSRTRIIVLDACRNSPVSGSTVGRGLAQLTAPEGSFVAFSTAPGMVAADGNGRNSPFAGALLEELDRPRQPIEAVFRNVRRSVLRATNGAQIPWDSSSLLEPFFFA